jgi:hypothetical protein
MGGEDLKSLEIDNPFLTLQILWTWSLGVEEFIDGQYFHIPRANLGPGTFETLSHHSEWRLVSCVTLPITLAVPGLIQISYSLPHALLEHNQNNPLSSCAIYFSLGHSGYFGIW